MIGNDIQNRTVGKPHKNNKTPAEAGVPVGLTRIELVTSSLSGMRSNRLSYSEGRNPLPTTLSVVSGAEPSVHNERGDRFSGCSPTREQQ